MTYATSADVLSRWVGNGKPADTDQVDTFCGDAETLIYREFPDLDDRVAGDGGITAEHVKLVVVAMVTRVYKAPERIQSQNDPASDQFGGTVVYAGENPSPLHLTAAERAILAPPRLAGLGGLRTITTTRGDLETTDVYVDVIGEAPLPVGPPDYPTRWPR